MKRLIVVAVLALGAATDANAREGCSVVGTWTTRPGSSFLQWMSTMNGEGSAGTLEVESPALDPAFLPPGWTGWSTLRGVWQRTGGNTFAFTQVGWLVDATGTPLFFLKNSGMLTLSENCAVMKVDSTAEAFLPGMEPYYAGSGAQPIAPPQQLPAMTAYRVVVEPPPDIP